MLKRRPLTLFLGAFLVAPTLAAIPGGSVILAILGISFLIFVHEWGHFAACKLTGTRTETFSIGFGPRLFGWEKDREGARRFTVGSRQLDPEDHAMDFRVAAIPLGGYVKMAGELPGEETPGGAPDEFPSKSAGARAFIICAGVIMNLLTAIVFYGLTYNMNKAFVPPIVGHVEAGGAAWDAGLQAGDRIVTLGGKDIETRVDLLTEAALMSFEKPTPATIKRGDKTISVDIQGRYDEEVGRGRLQVLLAQGAAFGERDAPFSIGLTEPISIDGVHVVGGTGVLDALKTRFALGKTSATLTRQNGESFSLALNPRKDAPGAKDLPIRIGIARARPLVVERARGALADVLQKSDMLLGYTDGDGAFHSLASAGELELLPWQGKSIQSLRIRRFSGAGDSGSELDLPAVANTPRAVITLIESLSFVKSPPGTMEPLAAGYVYQVGEGIYRMPGSPALDAGLRAGDRLVRVGEQKAETIEAASLALKNVVPDKPIEMEVVGPDGKPRILTVVPKRLEPLGSLPVLPHLVQERYKPDGFFHALGMGAARTWREVKNVFRMIGALFSGRLNFNKSIAGPITMIDVSNNMAEESMPKFIWFLAYISVMLAVMNILPIPVLDGGHLLFIIIEKIKGSPLKPETMYNFQKVGMVLLLVLMFFALKNDITRLFSL